MPKKHPGGRPPSFNSPEELQEKIAKYFVECKGKGRGWKTIPSKAGLANSLGVVKDTLQDYGRKPQYSSTIKEAYQRIEQVLIEQLFKPYPTGVIFYLKNAFKDEYRDRYDHTTDGKEMPAPVILSYGPKDRLQQVMEKRKSR